MTGSLLSIQEREEKESANELEVGEDSEST